MNSIERTVMALQGKEPDRVPTCPILCGASRRIYGVSYAEWSQDPEIRADSWAQGYYFCGMDASATLIDLSLEAADWGQEVVFPLEDTAHPNYDNPLLTSPDDYETLPVIDWASMKNGRMYQNIKFHEMLADKIGKEHVIVAFVYGPLGILSMFRGAEKLFVECMKYKDQVHKAMRTVTDVIIDYTKAMMKTGCHGIMLDTLFASSCIMSKRLWNSIEAPYAKEIADVVHAEGGQVMSYHNCGDGVYHDAQLESMNPAMASIACLPPDCADWHETKKKYFSGESEKPCTIAGYMAPAANLFLGNPDIVKEEVKKEIGELSAGGYHIMAPGCEFPPNGSLLNLLAFQEGSELYGQYPISV